jgi:hypothetical protein
VDTNVKKSSVIEMVSVFAVKRICLVVASTVVSSLGVNEAFPGILGGCRKPVPGSIGE